MGKDPGLPLPQRKRLTEADRARVLALLRELETAAMFTAGWDETETDLYRWTNAVRAGHLWCAEVPRMLAAFVAYGVLNRPDWGDP